MPGPCLYAPRPLHALRLLHALRPLHALHPLRALCSLHALHSQTCAWFPELWVCCSEMEKGQARSRAT